MIEKNSPNRMNDNKRPGIRPSFSIFQRIDIAVRSMVPMTFAVFIVLFLSTPFDIPARNELLLAIVVATVYFWSIYRPESMPAVGVFIIGLLIDLLNFSVPGIVIFLLLIVHGIVVTQRLRLVKYNFLFIWLFFDILAIAIFVLQWTLTSIFNMKVMPYYSSLFEIIFAIGIYPLLSILFAWAHRTIANPSKA